MQGNGNGYIPPATAEKLLEDIPKGQRHKAKIDIAIPLIGNGISESEVAAILRAKFNEASEKEINDVVRYAVSVRPTPSTGLGPVGYAPRWVPRQPAAPEPPKRTVVEQCEWWSSGNKTTPDALVKSSTIPIPEDPSEACALALASLYSDDDFLNIVCQFTVDEKKPEKTRPQGGGKVLSRDDWIIWFRDKGIPQSKAGAWFRINPCGGIGSGKDGSITDEDVTAYRYLLVESDDLPLAVSLALYQRLKIPIAAILLSGGKSAHAWVKMDSANAEKYDKDAERILVALKPFGIDQSNSNPSRLSRLPGAIRTIGAQDGGAQRLLWLNPSVAAVTDESLKLFEESLLLPAIEEKPLQSLANKAVDRYKELLSNAGKTGVPYGIPQLDWISGGMKPGQTIVVAGVTGGGKSTLGLHMVDSALERGYGVALFSLEMDKEEVFDLLVAKRCRINRNKFNNGRFVTADFSMIEEVIPKMGDLPLYIDDTAMTGVEQIRLRVMQLKSAGKIGLVVVDYIQFVNPDWSKDNREQQVAVISHKLRALSRETRIPFVILSQLNDEGKLRESRVISHNANVVLMIEVAEVPETEQNPNSVEVQAVVSVVKGRGIPKAKYSMVFDRMFATLIGEEVEKNQPELPT